MTPTDDGNVAEKCPAEIAIDDRREKELSDLGLIPLVCLRNSGTATFLGAQSIQTPAVYDDPSATAAANLAARLPYLFPLCRFAHYLRAIARDYSYHFSGPGDMQKYLQNWLSKNYVDVDPETSAEALKARRPLRAAEILIEQSGDDSEWYTGKFYLSPHYQFEGIVVSQRIILRLPSVKAAS
jgi:type VI secretion system protein ImpC